MNAINLSLYQLTNEHDFLLSQLYDHETGEVNQEIENKLMQLDSTAVKKCTSIASYIRRMEADKEQLEKLEQEIYKRKKSYDKEMDRLKAYLKSNMERMEIDYIRSPFFQVKIKTNPHSTEIINEELIPQKFLNVKIIEKTEVKPDKNAIKEEVLRTGVQVPGAYVSQKTKLEIIVDKI